MQTPPVPSPAAAAPPPAEGQPGSDAERLAQGWALKDDGYAALYSEPPRVQQALQQLDALAAGAETAAAQGELRALHDWLAGAQAALRGAAAEAVQRLDAAYAALQAAGRPREAAASQVPKLIALTLLGRHDDAVACGERTREQLVAAGDGAAAGRVEINLGSMLLRRHRYGDAALQYRRAAVRFAQAGDTRHSVMADIGLAGALSWQLEFDEAALIFDRAAARARAHGLAQLEATVDHNRGLLALRRGRTGDALRWLALALQAYERDGAPQPLAEARRGLADAYLAVNLLPEAVALYDQAVRACLEHPAATEQAWATMQRALARAAQGHDAEAARDLIDARALFLDNGHPIGAARAATHAAALALKAGAAQRALSQATDAARELAGAGLAGWAEEAESLVAQALLALGQGESAGRLWQQLLQRPALPAGLRARCALGQADLARTRGDAEAETLALEQAARAVESQRTELAADEFRTAWAADKQAPFERLLGLALAPLPPGFGRVTEAQAARLLAALERGRAAALGLARGERHRRAGTDDAARLQLGWLQREWQQRVAMGRSAEAQELAGRMAALETALQERMRRAEAQSLAPRPPRAAEPGASAMPVAPDAPAAPDPPLATLQRLQAALGGDEAAVMFGWSGPLLVACVVGPDGPWAGAWPAHELAARLEQLRFQIDALRYGVPTAAPHQAQLLARAQAHLQALHALLWVPLLPALRGSTRVLLVPGGPLHYVPFAALHDGRQAVLDGWVLQQAPSVALALAARASAGASPPRRVLALGIGGDALPHVAAEVRGVGAAFGADATVLLDDAATLPALRQALPGADVLHLACHGQFRADSPYFSSLQLADGPLALRDAAALPLAGVSVTLSACETGLSRIAPGDELLGLVRGFLMAGSPRVMATQWTVDDASTATLMDRFYRGWRQGLPAAEALCDAQRALRREQPHPYHWAPFVLHGGL